MTSNETTNDQKLGWFSRPESGHLVHFYQDEDSLLTPLTDYISASLLREDICIVIATTKHTELLNKRLGARELDVLACKESGQYITLDADVTLSKILVDGLPDKKRFNEAVGTLIETSTKQGKKVRAYGEMVAQLWRMGNKKGVMRLEQLWNELGEIHSFSLFCAYPELHFITHREAIEEIRTHHNVNLPILQTMEASL